MRQPPDQSLKAQSAYGPLAGAVILVRLLVVGEDDHPVVRQVPKRMVKNVREGAGAGQGIPGYQQRSGYVELLDLSR